MLIGIGLNVVALVFVIPVAIMQRRTGKTLGNQVVVAQSGETWISNYLGQPAGRARAQRQGRPVVGRPAAALVLPAAHGDDDGVVHGDDVNRTFRAVFVGVVAR